MPTTPMLDVLREAEAFAMANRQDPVAQREWAQACPAEHRAYFCEAMDRRPRVQLQGLDELTMELADELPLLSWELRQLIHVARPIWDEDVGRELVS